MKKPIYERNEKESVKAFEAFSMYRDLGITRSIREVAQKLNKSVALIGRWSSNYDWVERVKEFDNEMDRKALLQQEKARREMVKRHANQAMMFQQKVLERMQRMKPEELSPGELIRWFSESVKIERLSRGESTDIAEVSHSGEVTEKHEFDITQRIDKYEGIYSRIAEHSTVESDNEDDDS